MDKLATWQAAMEPYLAALPVPPGPGPGKPPHRMGVHLIGNAEANLVFTAALNPAAVKIVDPDPAVVRRVLSTTGQHCIVILRNHPRSEEKAQAVAEPQITGLRHANEWIADLTTGRFAEFRNNPRIAVVGINEPGVHNLAEELGVYHYTKAFLERLTQAEIRGLALNLSVGWPRSPGPGLPPTWESFRPLEPIILAGKHFLCVHEYWHPTPQTGWGNYANRISHCPMSVPIIVGENAYTRQLINAAQPWGWQGNISADTYAEQLWYYNDNVDPNVYATMTFTTGYGGPEWANKDTGPAHAAILARKRNYTWPAVWPVKKGIPPPPPPVPPPAGDLPPIVWPKMPRITQWYNSGHSGLDIALPTGYPLYAMYDGVVAWSGVDEAANGGYGIYCRCRYPLLGFDSLMAHLKVCYKKTGDKVVRGEKIGEVDSTGNSTGSHLHLEIRISDDGGLVVRSGVGPFSRGQVDPMAVRWSLEKVLGVEER